MADDLRKDMQAAFKNVDDKFAAIGAEFVAVRAEFVAVRAEMAAGFEKVDDRFDKVDARIKAEGETTRRHFDIVAEQFRDYVKVLADGTARNTERLDGHEIRITTLEQPRS